MVKHTQTIGPEIADELFECIWPFYGLALKGLTNSNLKSEAELLKKKQQHKSGYCILRNCSHGKTQFAV